MEPVSMTDNSPLVQPIIRLIITLVIVVIVGQIIGSLPGTWSISPIISLVIAVIIIAVLYKFAMTFGPLVQNGYPHIPEIGSIVTNVIYLLCLFVAYIPIREFLSRFLWNFTWIFDLIIFAAGLYLVYLIAVPLLKSTEKLSEVISDNVKQKTKFNKVCTKCGTQNPISNKFCDKCGNALDLQ